MYSNKLIERSVIMYKFKISLIALLLIALPAITYCAFTTGVEKTGSIQTTELSTTLLSNSDFLTKVQSLDSTIISIDKTTDLNRINTVPTVNLTDDNIVSTQESSVPVYLWIDNGTIYYYTIATNIDINNN